IDGAGRIVIPKSLRDRMNLSPGARLHIFEEAGCLIILPDRPEPRLVEQDGFLALDFGTGGSRQYRLGRPLAKRESASSLSTLCVDEGCVRYPCTRARLG